MLGLGALLLTAVVPLAAASVLYGQVRAGMSALAATAVLTCLASAALVVFLYQAAGTLLGGTMLLFFAVSGQHFLAGGFLPLVFLPPALQKLAPVLPSTILMDGVRMAVTGVWSMAAVCKLAAMIVAGLILTAVMEVREE